MVQRAHTVGSTKGTYYESFSQDGADTPRAMREKGLWPINPYTLQKEVYLRSFGRVVNSSGGLLDPTWYSTDTWGVTPTIKGPVWPSYASLMNKLGERWRNTDLNLGMYFSPEGRESIGSMISLLQRTSNGVIALRRGDFGGFLRNMNELPRSHRKVVARKFDQGDISGAFLSAHLGWEPLIKDLYEASNLNEPKIGKHRISARKAGSQSYTCGSIPGVVVTSSSDTSQRFTLDMTKSPTFSQRFGLDNPFLIAWELVPLSFVADYFLPIGDVINAWGNVSALYGQRGFSKSFSTITVKSVIPKGTKLPGKWRYQDGYADRDIFTLKSKTYFNRSTFSPSFADVCNSASLRLPKSVMKLATLSALTHQSILSLARKGSKLDYTE